MAARVVCRHCGWRPVTWTEQRLRLGYLMRQHGLAYEESKALQPMCGPCASAAMKVRKRAKVACVSRETPSGGEEIIAFDPASIRGGKDCCRRWRVGPVLLLA